jgi:hypothetical protein
MILASITPAFASLSPTGLHSLAPSFASQLPLGFAFISPFLIPILVPAIFFLFIASMVGMGLLSKTEQEKARQATIRLAIEKGQPLPPELLKEGAPREKADDRKAGLILVAVGVGSFIALRVADFIDVRNIEWFAAVPFLIGVALLINHALQAKKPL